MKSAVFILPVLSALVRGGTVTGKVSDEVEISGDAISDRIMRTPDVYGNIPVDLPVLRNLDALVAASCTGEMEVPHDCENPVINTCAPMVTVDADLRWEVQGCFLDNALTFKAGVKSITDEFQEDLDQGSERDAGYVYGPATPRTFTIGLEVGI